MPLSPAKHAATPGRPPARGVTLIELLVVIAIAAILVGVGLPNLTEYISTNRLDTATNELQSELQFARSEALRRGQPVSMRLQATAGSADWGSAGWITFVDVDGNGAEDAGDERVRTVAAQAGGMTIYGSAGLVTALTFAGDGRLRSAAGAFVICDAVQQLVVDGRARARAVVVGASGRVRQARDTAGNDKIPETDVGSVTDCRTP